MISSTSSCCPAPARTRRRSHRSPTGGGRNGTEVQTVELASAHILAGLYSLAHRIGLTDADLRLLEDQATSLSPALWDETRATLELADQGGEGTELDLGFLPAIFSWLGVSGEAEFITLYGLGPAATLARDCGKLSPIAAALEGDRSRPLPLEVSHAWGARATRLLDGLPDTAQAVLESLERALNGLPWKAETARPLFEAIVHVAQLAGDEERLSGARKILERMDREAAVDEPNALPIGVVAQVFTALWCLTHEGLVLEEESALEPGIAPPPDEAWSQIVDAVLETRLQDFPVPVALLKAWGAPEDLAAEAVRDCVQRCTPLLPQIVSEVSRLWGGDRPDMEVFDEVARAVAGLALVRHQGLYEGWAPLLGEPSSSIWIEVHQGAQRLPTLERAELFRRLRPVLRRAEADPLVVATAHLDAAAEARAQGQPTEALSHLQEAQRCTAGSEDPVRRAYGATAVAHYIWLAGDADEAMRRLRALEGEHAQNLLQTIEAHAAQREALRGVEQSHAERQDIDSMCALVASHVAAGHSVQAEATAREALQRFPDDPKAWNLVAWLLYVIGHDRHALVAALEALDKDVGRTVGVSLLARILSHLGSEWSEESARLAGEALQSDDAREVLPSDVLAELADIVQYHGSDIAPARLADDLVAAMSADDPPPVEWFGAAAARRCQGEDFAEDAPAWLARVVDARRDAPAELARFIVERTEFLLWLRGHIDREIEAGPRSDSGEPGGSMSAQSAQARARSLARSAAAGAALRAANVFHGESDLDEGEGSRAPGELDRNWQPHLATLAGFGDLVVCLRASELAQELWFGARELGERDLLVVRETLDRERVGWIRWTDETCEVLADLGGIPGLSATTRARLQSVFEAAEIEDDAELREEVWRIRWWDSQ